MTENLPVFPELRAFNNTSVRAFSAALLCFAAVVYGIYDPQGIVSLLTGYFAKAGGMHALAEGGRLFRRCLLVASVTTVLSCLGVVLASVPGGKSRMSDLLKRTSILTWFALGGCQLVGLFCDPVIASISLLIFVCIAGTSAYRHVREGIAGTFFAPVLPLFALFFTFCLGWFLTYFEDGAQLFAFDARSIVWAAGLLGAHLFRFWGEEHGRSK
jgi:hypothetical protein